jgi:hypothetical protein
MSEKDFLFGGLGGLFFFVKNLTENYVSLIIAGLCEAASKIFKVGRFILARAALLVFGLLSAL